MEADDADDGPADWDSELAECLVGATLLVGLTYLRHDGTLDHRRQFFGRVLACERSRGIVLEDEDNGERLTIAPLLEAIEPAGPGLYQLSDVDRVVEDPDFTALMTVTMAARA